MHGDSDLAESTRIHEFNSKSENVLVEVVVPVYNEEDDLERSIRRLHAYLISNFPYGFRITIADNASVDRTPEIAEALATEFERVESFRLERKGRGRALRAVWSSTDATVLAYMDVDLSTGLDAFLPLVAPLISGHSAIAIGSRLASGSLVTRGPKREVISRCYNFLLWATLRTRFSDAQCGFKAIRADVARILLPAVEDDAFFFDTELLVLAERSGFRIHEVPVDWIDDTDSRCNVTQTALEDLRGIARVGRRILEGRARVDIPASGPKSTGRQLGSFATIGVASTLAYLVFFALLQSSLGSFGANALAVFVTWIGNTIANRRVTFGRFGRQRMSRLALTSAILLATALAGSSVALAFVDALPTRPTLSMDVGALLIAHSALAVWRFLLLRYLVFGASGADIEERSDGNGEVILRGAEAA